MMPNCSSCSGGAVDVGAEVEHVGVAACSVGSTVAIAGRSMPGSVFSTKREIAISAPVLPALTQACASPALHEVDRDAHRGVLLAAQRLRRRLVHLHDLGWRGARAGARPRRAPRAASSASMRVLAADQDERRRRAVARQVLERGGHRHVGAVVAPHAVDGNRHWHRVPSAARAQRRGLLVLGLDDLLAAVVAGRADVVAQVHLAAWSARPRAAACVR